MNYPGEYDWNEHNRQEIQRGTNSLQRTSESILRSQQIAIETEEVGVGVIGTLNEQRETLLRSKNRLENMDDGLSKSNRIIKSLGRNVLYNKITLIVIILLEVGILVGLIFIKFFTK